MMRYGEGPILFLRILPAVLLALSVPPADAKTYADQMRPFSSELERLAPSSQRQPTADQYVEKANILRDAAYYFLDSDIFEAALRSYDDALAQKSDHQGALFGKAVLLYESHRFEEAYRLLESIQSAQDTKVKVYRNISKYFMERGKDTSTKAKENAPEGLCDFCRQPMNDRFWQFGDKKLMCQTCFGESLNNPDDLAPLFERVAEVMTQKLGLNLAKKPSCRLVDSSEMQQVAGQNLNSFDGVTPENLAGLYSHGDGRPVIFILQGMPKEETASVIAHEYAHAWQTENCPNTVSLGSREGFSEWVSFQVAQELGFTRKAITFFLDLSEYGQNFKRLEAYGRVVEKQELIQLMKEGAL